MVIIPILHKTDDSKLMLDKCFELQKTLRAAGIRTAVDDRDNHNPGFKFNDWEVKGTPLRLELGNKDFEAGEVRVAVRHNSQKFQAKWDNLADEIGKLLDTIHNDMYNKAKAARTAFTKRASNWEEFMDALNGKNICLAPWCDTVQCEKNVKDQSKNDSLQKMAEANEDEVTLTGSAKTLCIPLEQPELSADCKCFNCGKPAKVTALWGRSY